MHITSNALPKSNVSVGDVVDKVSVATKGIVIKVVWSGVVVGKRIGEVVG